MLQALLIALQLLTRLPVKVNTPVADRSMGQSLLFYPLVGVIIGAMLVTIMLLLHQHTSSFILAAVLLSFWVLITGALHLDGLADSADAWLGGFGDRQRSLDIMKDPRCGPAAVVAIILILLLKLTALEYLVRDLQWQAILIAAIMSRTLLLALFISTPYVRENGLGATLAQHIPHTSARAIFLSVVIAIIIWTGIQTAIIFFVAGLVWLYLRYMMISRIKGMTGDTAGASVEIMEAVLLLGYCFW